MVEERMDMDKPAQASPLRECQYKWRYRKLYPGILELSPQKQSVEPLDAERPAPPNTDTDGILRTFPPRRKPKQSPSSKDPTPGVTTIAKPMDSFRKYHDSVKDAWLTEDPEEVPDSASSSGLASPTENTNGYRMTRTLQNRYSSEHLKAKGLQRLAMQSGFPGMQAQGMVGRSVRLTFPSLSKLTSSSAVAMMPSETVVRELGAAVRSMGFYGSDQPILPGDREPSLRSPYSPTNSPNNPLDFLPRHTQKSEKFFKLLSEKAIDLEALRKLSWSGIPVELRGTIWRLLCGYAPPLGDSNKLQESLQRKREEYQSLVNEYYPKKEDEHYKDTFRQIHIDVPRMCPLVALFQQTLVQEIFERVLFIWALRNPASGYVQGINDLVTPYFIVFLRDYIPPKDIVEEFPCESLPAKSLSEIEADSFWCLSKLLAGIQNNYTFAQPGIQQRVLQLKDLIQRVDGELHRHLERCTVEYLQFSFRWMNNLLIRELPLKCVIRLWDSYHSEIDGFACFHVYVCASFLLWWSDDLKQQPDFQYSLLLLQNLPTQNWGEDEIERLLAKAYMLKYAFADAPRHLRSS